MDPSMLQLDDEAKDLQRLLDAFGSQCSLEEIAAAYCRANGDVNTAGEFLSEGCTHASNVETDLVQFGDSAEDNWTSAQPKNHRRSKKLTVSTGIVPNVVGRGLMSSHVPPTRAPEPTKPLKLQMEKVEPIANVVAVSNFVTNSRDTDNTEVEEFLFSMLQEGFKLDRCKILEVLGSCGYDGKKIMEELFKVPSPNGVVGEVTLDNEQNNPADTLSEMESNQSERLCPTQDHSQSPIKDVSSSVLEALFANTKCHEEPKRVRLKPGIRRTPVGRTVVSARPAETDNSSTFQESQCRKEGKEDDYDVLRSAAKQHWDSMKAYYEAAFDAFIRGEHDRVDGLLEQGKYHNKMAREADEKSFGEIDRLRCKDDESILTLDLHLHHPKDARSLLKQHLQSLAGIPLIRYLRVVVDSGDEDTMKGKRKQYVLDYLERKQIKWSAEDDKVRTLLIPLDTNGK